MATGVGRGRRLTPGASIPVLAVALAVAGMGCAGPYHAPPAPGATEWAAASPLLVRGRISGDEVMLEPVFRFEAAPSLPTEADGDHRLRGWDETGELLFDFRFDGIRVGDGGEEHFSFMIPPVTGGALSLERIELVTGDGRGVERRARFSEEELREALETANGPTVEAVGEDRVRVRWDAEPLPAILVRDAEDGRILSFARGGDATIVTGAASIEVVVSDGVRSLGRTFHLR